ncbi:lipid-A-disaccharide synthase [bacterium]|nr:lipid-A-disaccharide synthase [bacterium]
MTLRVLLVAGEASGDLHGAALVTQLRARRPDLEVVGIGGPRLRAAGMQVLVDTAHVATMGFTETFGTLGRLVAAYRTLVRTLDSTRPDLVVLVDYPEFNLRLAKQAKRRGIPVFYFVAPQVWAWRKGRIRTIAERVDKLAAVFPFEPGVYNAGGRHLAEHVGHPLLDVVRATRGREETRARYGLVADRPLLALLPGSRTKEVRLLFRAMCDAAASLAPEGWQSITALAESLAPDDLAAALGGRPVPMPVAHNDTYNVVAAADAAIVASGTATVETALLGCPMVIVYRLAPLTYWIARRLVDVPWIGMPNIILQRPMFPELIQDAVTPAAIADAVRDVHRRHAEVAAALVELRAALGEPGAASRAAELALTLVGPRMNTDPNPQPHR